MANKKAPPKELLSLIKLISFFKQLRHKGTLDRTGFYFVNDLNTISPYRQCILWTYEADKVKIVSASGQIDVNPQSSYGQTLSRFLPQAIERHAMKDEVNIREKTESSGYAQIQQSIDGDLLGIFSEENSDIDTKNACLVFLYDDLKLIGGVWLLRQAPLGDIEKALLEDVGDALSDKLQYFQKTKRKSFSFFKASGVFKKIALVALLCLLLFPVRFSITAPAEIVPQVSEVVTIPFNALVTDVYVRPNARVKEGERLFGLDKTQLQNQYNQALQELRTAQQRLSKTERQVFADATKSAELNILRELVKSKDLEVNFAKESLDLADVKAPRSGIALFSDKNDLIGKPIKVGDAVMIVAEEGGVELLAKLPAGGMININRDVPAKFFLNTNPLKGHKAQIKTVSYKPTPDADRGLTYKARAEILEPENISRVGLTGTTKLYGGRTVLVVNVMRRPFIALRNLIGI